MRELFRERDPALVGMYQSLLEAAGIPTHVRNRDLVVMMTEVPIPEFFPALCVVEDEDYERALAILRKSRGADAGNGGSEAAAGATEVPYETRGIILAGAVLLCVLALLAGAAIIAVLLAEPEPKKPVIAVCAVLMVGAVLIAARTTRAYLATRRRATRES